MKWLYLGLYVCLAYYAGTLVESVNIFSSTCFIMAGLFLGEFYNAKAEYRHYAIIEEARAAVEKIFVDKFINQLLIKKI